MRVLLLVLVLGTAVSGCGADPDAPGPADRGYADHLPTQPLPSADPCDLPVAERTGGWLCPGAAPPAG